MFAPLFEITPDMKQALLDSCVRATSPDEVAKREFLLNFLTNSEFAEEVAKNVFDRTCAEDDNV